MLKVYNGMCFSKCTQLLNITTTFLCCFKMHGLQQTGGPNNMKYEVQCESTSSHVRWGWWNWWSLLKCFGSSGRLLPLQETNRISRTQQVLSLQSRWSRFENVIKATSVRVSGLSPGLILSCHLRQTFSDATQWVKRKTPSVKTPASVC